MTKSAQNNTAPATPTNSRSTGRFIALSLLLGLLCGLVFGEYCQPLEVLGRAYVGLLQMTVLPYLILSLTSKTARLDVQQARRLGLVSLLVLLGMWLIGVVLVVLVSAVLPPVQGASFFSPQAEQAVADDQDLLSRFIPTNIFHSLSAEYVPAVVVFSLFFGGALMVVPAKERLLDFLDLCSQSIERINTFLVRSAPIGLFTLSAAAAGTMRIDEFSRLQAYLIMFTLACLAAAFGVLPLLVSSVTPVSYRALLGAAQEPLLTAVATGKLFVVLPQISEKCEQLIREEESVAEINELSASVVVPLAYPLPHLGKILAFVFVSFAAWYVGRGLTPGQTVEMAATGAASSFASPLVSMPYLLDQYQLPQDLMTLFILPGFISMRLADVVGVMHLMAVTLIVTHVLQGGLRIRWGRLLSSTCVTLVCLGLAGTACRLYLASTTLTYDLDRRLLSLEVPAPHDEVSVYRSRADVPARAPWHGDSTLERIKAENVVRVGYHPDHLPYSFFNQQRHLVGLDVELMHRLAAQLEVRLEFVPYAYDTLPEQLETGEIDVAVGGLMMKPERLLLTGFTQPYQVATVAVVLSDHRRHEFDTWEDPLMSAGLRLGVLHEDIGAATRRQLPNVEVVTINSIGAYFSGDHDDLDGLVMAAEEAAAWNVLFPDYSVVVPQPIVQRPVGMVVRSADTDWLRLLDRWLDFERLDGSLDRLRVYWVEGGGTQDRQPRWCVIRDVLHWVP